MPQVNQQWRFSATLYVLLLSQQMNAKVTSNSNSVSVNMKLSGVCQEILCCLDTVFKSCWEHMIWCQPVTTHMNTHKHYTISMAMFHVTDLFSLLIN